MINYYRDFLILESILDSSDDFYRIIYDLKKNDPVADSIFRLIGYDIDTKFNYLTIGNKNDEVGFQNDNQYQRNTSDKTPKNFAKVGRLVNQILSNNNYKHSDREIESFVNKYKSYWDRKYSKMEDISLVSGEDIRYWYDGSNYVPGGGQLNSSCMRSKSYLFDIYVENPNVCQLLILIDGDRRLLGRALVWRVEGGLCPYYLDRIYTRYDSDVNRILEWFSNFVGGVDHDTFETQGRGYYVQLKKCKFEKYPYMDTFTYLDVGNKQLIPYEQRDSSRMQYRLDHTDGTFSVDGHYFSKRLNLWILHENSVRILDGSEYDYVTLDMATEGWNGGFILKDFAVWSDFYKGYILSKDAIELKGFGLVDKNDIVKVHDDVNLDPKDYLASKLSDGRYVRAIHNGRNINLSKDKCTLDAGRGIYVSNEDIASKKDLFIPLYTISSDKIPGFEVFDTYFFSGDFRTFGHRLDFGVVSSMVPYGIILGGKNLVSRSGLEMFGLSASIPTQIIQKSDYANLYSNSVPEISVDFVKSEFSNTDGKVKEIIEFCNIMKNSGNYNYHLNNMAYKIISDHGSVLNYINSLILPIITEFYDKLDFEHMVRYLGGSSSEISILFKENKKNILACIYFRCLCDRSYRGNNFLPMDIVDLLNECERFYPSFTRVIVRCIDLVRGSLQDKIRSEMSNLGIYADGSEKMVSYWDNIYIEFVEKQ